MLRLPSDPNPIARAAMDAMDAVALLLPRGWRTARVELGPERRVEALEAKAFEDEAREPYADLGFDHGAWIAAAGEAFRRLDEALEEEGHAWEGSVAVAHRVELESAKLLLREDDSPVIEIPIALPIARGQLVNDELFAILVQSLTVRLVDR